MMPLLMPCFAYHLPLSLNYNTLTWKIQARFLSNSCFRKKQKHTQGSNKAGQNAFFIPALEYRTG